MIDRCIKATVFATMLVGGTAQADPETDTCRFLTALAANDAAAIPGLVKEIAPALTQQGGVTAAQQIQTMLQVPIFDGGSAWVIGDMGSELQEHLILLRLREGEVAGARLRYEAFDDGMSLVSLEFHRKFNRYTEKPFLQSPEAIDCD